MCRRSVVKNPVIPYFSILNLILQNRVPRVQVLLPLPKENRLDRGGFCFDKDKITRRHAERAGQHIRARPADDEASICWRSGQNLPVLQAGSKFWKPQEGLRSNFKSFCPCQRKIVKFLIYQGVWRFFNFVEFK